MIHHIENGQIITEVTKSSKLVIVDFFATWCVPCQMMTEVLHDVEKEYESDIEIFKVDVDENQDTAIRYEINSMPTLVFFKDGEEVERRVGFIEKDQLVSLIEELK